MNTDKRRLLEEDKELYKQFAKLAKKSNSIYSVKIVNTPNNLLIKIFNRLFSKIIKRQNQSKDWAALYRILSRTNLGRVTNLSSTPRKINRSEWYAEQKNMILDDMAEGHSDSFIESCYLLSTKEEIAALRKQYEENLSKTK